MPTHQLQLLTEELARLREMLKTETRPAARAAIFERAARILSLIRSGQEPQAEAV